MDINYTIYEICDNFLRHVQYLEEKMTVEGYKFRDPLSFAHDANLVPSAAAYLIRMWRKMPMDLESMIHLWASAFFYLNSLVLLRRVSVNPRNYGTLMVGALILAMKMEYDVPYDNKSFALITTNGLPTVIINSIENLFIQECGLTNEKAKDASPFPVLCAGTELYADFAADLNKIFDNAI